MKRGTVNRKNCGVPFLERRQPMEDTAILELYWARDDRPSQRHKRATENTAIVLLIISCMTEKIPKNV